MKQTIKSILNHQTIKYLITGVLTTIIYFIIKMFIFSVTKSGVISEIIAQSISILFAYITNKLWVFDPTPNQILHEFIKFTMSRLLLLFISILANWYFVDSHPQLIINIFHLKLEQSVFVLSLMLQCITIILNYLFSKFLIFKKT